MRIKIALAVIVVVAVIAIVAMKFTSGQLEKGWQAEDAGNEKQAIEHYYNALRDASEKYRAAAAEGLVALGRKGHPGVTGLLIDVLGEGGDYYDLHYAGARATAARALGRLGDAKAAPALLEVIERYKNSYQESALIGEVEALQEWGMFWKLVDKHVAAKTEEIRADLTGPLTKIARKVILKHVRKVGAELSKEEIKKRISDCMDDLDEALYSGEEAAEHLRSVALKYYDDSTAREAKELAPRKSFRREAFGYFDELLEDPQKGKEYLGSKKGKQELVFKVTRRYFNFYLQQLNRIYLARKRVRFSLEKVSRDFLGEIEKSIRKKLDDRNDYYDENELKAIIAYLKSDELQKRTRAETVLHEFLNEGLLERFSKIIKAMQTMGPPEIPPAVRSLGDLRDKRAVDELIGLLDMEYVNREAAMALGKIKDERSAEFLERAFASSDSVRDKCYFAAALSMLGRRQYEEFLRETLALETPVGEKKNIELKRSALEVITRVRMKGFLPACLEELKKIQQETATQSKTALELYMMRMDELIQDLTRATGMFGAPDNVKDVLPFLSETYAPSIRSEAIRAIERLGPGEARGELLAILEKTGQKESFAVRLSAARALMKAGQKSAADVIRRVYHHLPQDETERAVEIPGSTPIERLNRDFRADIPPSEKYGTLEEFVLWLYREKLKRTSKKEAPGEGLPSVGDSFEFRHVEYTVSAIDVEGGEIPYVKVVEKKIPENLIYEAIQASRYMKEDFEEELSRVYHDSRNNFMIRYEARKVLKPGIGD